MKKKLLSLIPLLFLAGCAREAGVKINQPALEAESQFSVTYAFTAHADCFCTGTQEV